MKVLGGHKEKIKRRVEEIRAAGKISHVFKEGSYFEWLYGAIQRGASIESMIKHCGDDEERTAEILRTLLRNVRNGGTDPYQGSRSAPTTAPKAPKAPKVQPVRIQAPPQPVILKVAENRPVMAQAAVSTGGDMSRYIPQHDGYIPQKVVKGMTDLQLVRGMYDARLSGSVKGKYLLLSGETGCGKTHLIRSFCYEQKLPYFRITLNGSMTQADILGQMIPNPDPNDAKYIWADGMLATAMRYGGVVVLDEINMCPGDILSIIHGATDDERRIVLTEKDGEVVVAHPNFWCAATMNPDYEGTKPLNLALKDRFRPLTMTYNQVAEKKLIDDEKLLDVAQKLRDSADIHSPVSTRALLSYMDDRKTFSEDIARLFFVNRFDSDEQPVVKEMLDLTLGGL